MSVELIFTASIKGTPQDQLESHIYDAQQSIIDAWKRMIALACDTASNFIDEHGDHIPRHRYVMDELDLYLMQYHEAATRLTLLTMANEADDLEESV